MHCGAEVTESSTNKQHHLSLGMPVLRRKAVAVEHRRALAVTWVGNEDFSAKSFVIGPAVINTHTLFLHHVETRGNGSGAKSGAHGAWS
jgi:hypothetical protein